MSVDRIAYGRPGFWQLTASRRLIVNLGGRGEIGGQHRHLPALKCASARRMHLGEETPSRTQCETGLPLGHPLVVSQASCETDAKRNRFPFRGSCRPLRGVDPQALRVVSGDRIYIVFH